MKGVIDLFLTVVVCLLENNQSLSDFYTTSSLVSISNEACKEEEKKNQIIHMIDNLVFTV